MKNYTTDAPVWSDTIPVVEQNDLVNAENDSAAAKQLLQNILALRAMMVVKEEGKSLVSEAERNLWNMIYEQATGYTDNEIAKLINGAPSTLDTLGEIAAAMGENADVVQALENAIGTKANKTEVESFLGAKLDKTGDTKDNTVTFSSSDTTTPSGWTEVPALKSGETHKSFLQKVSTMFKNVRWLYKMLGTTDISAIGGGTVTGAINSLNTGMKTVVSSAYITGDYIKSEDLSAQRDGNHVKVSGGLKLAKAIPNAGNTVIGKIYTPSTPLADVYFLLVTPTGGFCLAYMSSEADIVVCNYLGADIAVGTNLYIIGLEWFFNSN